MYPNSLTHLARANPFSAPLFTLQKVEEPQQNLQGSQRTRRLAAAATLDGKPDEESACIFSYMSTLCGLTLRHCIHICLLEVCV